MRNKEMAERLARLKACRVRITREAYELVKSMILHGDEPELVAELLESYEARRMPEC